MSEPKDDDFFISGGNHLQVNSAQIDQMCLALQGTNTFLDEMLRTLEVQFSLLALRYEASCAKWYAISYAGIPPLTSQLLVLQHIWRELVEVVEEITVGPNGIVSIRRELGELQHRLNRALGIYVHSDDEIKSLITNHFLECRILPQVAKQLADRKGFPPVFTVGNRKFYTRQMSDVQLAAVRLSWWQAHYGAEIYGNTRTVAVQGKGLNRTLNTPGFEDSPELNAAWGNQLHDPSRFIMMANWCKSLPVSTLTMIVAPIGGGLELADSYQKYLIGSRKKDIYRVFAAFEEYKRQRSAKGFNRTATGRALGVDKSERLATKILSTREYDRNHAGGGTDATSGAKRRFPRDIGDVLHYSDTINPKGGGAFEVQQWQTAGGQKGVRVILRGTESWDAGSMQTQDMLTNTEEVAGLESGQRQAVKAALESLGVNRNTPVELVGHSQAGIVATNLAADPDFERHYNVKSLITAGAPIAGAKIPEKVKSLSLVNINDRVAQLDAANNSDSANHITVYGDFGNALNPSAAHDRVKTYARMADTLQVKNYLETDEFMNCRNKVMGFDDKILWARTNRFEVRRVYSN